MSDQGESTFLQESTHPKPLSAKFGAKISILSLFQGDGES